MGLLYGIALSIVNFLVFFLVIILLPGLPPSVHFPFKEHTVSRPKELKGALEPNYHLEGAERLLNGRMHGPECLIVRNNEIYTGIHGGEVVKLTAKHMTHVTKIGLPCEDITEESRCGRALGLAFDTLGDNLLIADAYYGIWSVDMKTKVKKLLVSPKQVLDGETINRPAKIFNGIAVDKQGSIYWTDSSSDVKLHDLVYAAFINPSGRLFKYDRNTNRSTVLLDELAFANGLALSPDEDFIVVAETGGLRLTKYHLKGPKAGKSEIFVDGLPGYPDNLTPDANGIWVPFVVSADNQHPSVFAMFSQFPSIRKFLSRILYILELPFLTINNYYPNKIAQRFIHFIGHGESVTLMSPKRATIVRLDWNGNIVGSLHGFDGSAAHISHVLELDDYLLLGSPYNRFLGRVKLPKPQKIKVQNMRYEGAGLEAAVKPQVTSTTPKPKTTARPAAATTTAKPTTTTTPKPTTTTTPKPTTTTTPKPTTTTTPKPTTTTTPKPTTTTTPKPTTTKKATTAKPKSAQRETPKNPAPVKEDIPMDTQPPKVEKLKVLSKEGKRIEL